MSVAMFHFTAIERIFQISIGLNSKAKLFKLRTDSLKMSLFEANGEVP